MYQGAVFGRGGRNRKSRSGRPCFWFQSFLVRWAVNTSSTYTNLLISTDRRYLSMTPSIKIILSAIAAIALLCSGALKFFVQ
jgi:hypothetical protein